MNIVSMVLVRQDKHRAVGKCAQIAEIDSIRVICLRQDRSYNDLNAGYGKVDEGAQEEFEEVVEWLETFFMLKEHRICLSNPLPT